MLTYGFIALESTMSRLLVTLVMGDTEEAAAGHFFPL
jgi:hypothetical protein